MQQDHQVDGQDAQSDLAVDRVALACGELVRWPLVATMDVNLAASVGGWAGEPGGY